MNTNRGHVNQTTPQSARQHGRRWLRVLVVAATSAVLLLIAFLMNNTFRKMALHAFGFNI